MIEIMVVMLVSLAIGVVAGFKLGYSYGRKVADGFNLTEWAKSLLPFGKFP